MATVSCVPLGLEMPYHPYPTLREDGPLSVSVTVRPTIMLDLREAWLTVKLEGALPDCPVVVISWGDGCTSAKQTCDLARIYHEHHHYHHYGTLKPTFTLLDNDKVLVQGSTTLQVGAPE